MRAINKIKMTCNIITHYIIKHNTRRETHAAEGHVTTHNILVDNTSAHTTKQKMCMDINTYEIQQHVTTRNIP